MTYTTRSVGAVSMACGESARLRYPETTDIYDNESAAPLHHGAKRHLLELAYFSWAAP